MCYCFAAHRYQQAKASGQGSHSKSSSAHSSRSTSPGPHWRNESIASRTTERQSLDPSGNSSSSPCRQGRSHRPSVFTERESSTGRTPPHLSRTNRDHSEPRHFKPFRCGCVCLCIHFIVLKYYLWVKESHFCISNVLEKTFYFYTHIFASRWLVDTVYLRCSHDVLQNSFSIPFPFTQPLFLPC